LGYTENDPLSLVDPGVTVTDVDSATLASATVQIGSGYVAGEDLLAFTPAGAVTGSFDATTGTLTFTASGPTTMADWQSVLQSVSYRNTSENPSTAPRTVTLIANDGVINSAPSIRIINVTAVNDAPSVTANSLTINDGATATLTLADLAAADPDNAAPGLIYTVSGIANGYFALTSAPTTPITTFTQADVAAGLVMFVHAGNNLPPTYTIQANDGALSSAPSTVTVTFNPTSGGAGTTPSTGGGGSGGTVVPPTEPPVGGGGTGTGGGSIDTSPLDVPASVSRGDGEEPAVEEAAPEPVAPVRVAAAKEVKPTVELEAMEVQSSEPTVTQNAQSFSAEFAQVRHPQEITVDLGKVALQEPDGDRLIKLDLDSIRMTSIALSVGAIWWATRATGLITSLLSSLPAWRNFDPLPVLGRNDDEDEDEWVQAHDAQVDEEMAEEERLARHRFSNEESQPVELEQLRSQLKR